jgi:hypothetical protein
VNDPPRPPESDLQIRQKDRPFLDFDWIQLIGLLILLGFLRLLDFFESDCGPGTVVVCAQ